MDKEAISASVTYDKLREQHFNGGYFSERVKGDVNIVMNFSEPEKRVYFAQAFNATYAIAEKIQAHPRFDTENKTIDLSEEGLGVIGIDLAHETAPDLDELGPYKGILVEVCSFNPVPRKETEWVSAPGDDLG